MENTVTIKFRSWRETTGLMLMTIYSMTHMYNKLMNPNTPFWGKALVTAGLIFAIGALLTWIGELVTKRYPKITLTPDLIEYSNIFKTQSIPLRGVNITIRRVGLVFNELQITNLQDKPVKISALGSKTWQFNILKNYIILANK